MMKWFLMRRKRAALLMNSVRISYKSLPPKTKATLDELRTLYDQQGDPSNTYSLRPGTTIKKVLFSDNSNWQLWRWVELLSINNCLTNDVIFELTAFGEK